MSSKSVPVEVIEVPDDDPDDFPDSGPQNPVEAQSYRDKINDIMETFGNLLADDCKDALRSSMAARPRKLAPHLRSGPSSCPSYCQVKCTWVALAEPPKGNKRGPTPVHEGDVAGDDPDLPPTKK